MKSFVASKAILPRDMIPMACKVVATAPLQVRQEAGLVKRATTVEREDFETAFWLLQ